MQEIERSLATIAVWAGSIGLSYAFNSFGHFDGGGALGITVLATILTFYIWS